MNIIKARDDHDRKIEAIVRRVEAAIIKLRGPTMFMFTLTTDKVLTRRWGRGTIQEVLKLIEKTNTQDYTFLRVYYDFKDIEGDTVWARDVSDGIERVFSRDSMMTV